MNSFDRLERNIKKLKENIVQEHDKIEKNKEKYEAHKITKRVFNAKRKHIEEKIRAKDSRIRLFQGMLTKKKRNLEEKAKKREEAKRRERNYFEWSEKNYGKRID